MADKLQTFASRTWQLWGKFLKENSSLRICLMILTLKSTSECALGVKNVPYLGVNPRHSVTKNKSTADDEVKMKVTTN